MITIDELNALSRDRFVGTVGWVFEHSPWVAERAWKHRPFRDLGHLHASLTGQVDQASPDEQLALLCAHPDLGTRARLTTASTKEQSSAGLDQLTTEEYKHLTERNTAYREKFGFPFLYAVKGSTKYDILRTLDQRLESTPSEEFRQALKQVYQIALFRLQETIAE